jgi:hypothetical protein
LFLVLHVIHIRGEDMSISAKKTLGSAIDDIVAALEALDEPSRTTAIRAACEHMGMTAPAASSASPATDLAPAPAIEGAPAISSAPTMQGITDIRTFKEQRQPGSAAEMACVVAYYLDTLAPPTERKQEISTNDLAKYFKQAGYPLPKRMVQVLVNARASGYFDSAGHGKYKLNPVGHNLVVHSLPKTKK